MKPNYQISRRPSRRDEEHSSPRRSNHPLTDCHFQAPATEMQSSGSSCQLSRPICAPGFRDLSNKFLGEESRRDYVVEVLFFAIIVGVSAWPIVSMVRALAQFVK